MALTPATLRLATLLVLVVVTSLVTARSQEQKPISAAQKFDEFGDIQMSDLKARLDNFAVMIDQTPDAMGFLIVYRSRRDLPGLSHSLALRMKDYLLNSRGISRNRLAVVDGGVADHLIQELWIVPRGAAPTPRADARIGYFHSPDVAWKFFEYGYLPREMYRRFGVDASADSDAEYLEAFADEVRKKPTNVACVIAYAQYNPRPRLVDYSGDYNPTPDVRLDPGGTARKRLTLERKRLTQTYGIPAPNIRTIDGGHRKERAVELWIVPAGEPLPIATPNSFPRPRTTKRK